MTRNKPRFTRRRTALLLFILVATASSLLSVPQQVDAHGELIASTPRANSVLTRAPDQVELIVSELPDLAFSSVKVLDRDGVQVDLMNMRLSAQGALILGLQPLDSGTYTVVWQVTTVSDTHRTTGAFRFTVSGGGRSFLNTGRAFTASGSATRPTLANTLIRWAELIGLSMIVGVVGVSAIVWRPVLSGISPEATKQVYRRFRIVALVGLAIVGVAITAGLINEAVDSFGGDSSIIGAMQEILAGSPFGLLFLLRLLIVVSLITLWGFQAKIGSTSWWLWTSVLLTGLLLLGRSLGSHAAATEVANPALGVGLDFAHLTAATLWIGGLLAMLVGVVTIGKNNTDATTHVLLRFSNLAILTVGLVGVTGIYNVWLEVGSIDALWDTSYGGVLLLKTGVLAPILALATLNLLSVRSISVVSDRLGFLLNLVRISRERLMGAEIALAFGIFGLTAVLANLPLARDAISQSMEAGKATMAMPALGPGGDVNVTLGINPNRVGNNTFLLNVSDSFSDPVDTLGLVTVQLFRLGDDIPVETIILKPRGDGRFSARSDALSIVGTWMARVVVTPEDQDTITLDYLFRTADQSTKREPFISGIINFLSGNKLKIARTGPEVPPTDAAEAGLGILRSADASMNSLGSVSECNNVNGVITGLVHNAPDLMRYSVAGGGESVIQGAKQWYRRDDSPWQVQARPESLRFPDFRYADNARGVRVEPSQTVNGRLQHLISFYSPRDDADYWFWVDAETRHIARLVMNVPPSHYMVSAFTGFDTSEKIVSPGEFEDSTTDETFDLDTTSCQNYLP